MNKKILILIGVILLILSILIFDIIFNIRNVNEDHKSNSSGNENVTSSANSTSNLDTTSKNDNNNKKDTNEEKTKKDDNVSNDTNSQSENVINKSSVKYNGWLKTNGSKLQNEKGENIQLRGISSHGICWFSDLITYNNLKELKENWNINVFRLAMYTDSNGQGYISNPSENKDKVCKIVDMAIDLDMYVIVDWHILSDNNPQIHKEEAKKFFDVMSKKYATTPNVIYEICNEPNGNDVTWDNSVKPYADEIIPIIRNNSSKSLIIVGTPFWCQHLDKAADNPLQFNNIVYSCHFYSGSHGEELRRKIDYCISKNIPVFVSECGLTDASGNGNVYFDKFQEWINYLNNNNISWLYWSFSNKNESSAILNSSYSPNAGNSDLNNYLTDSGQFIKNVFKSYNN